MCIASDRTSSMIHEYYNSTWANWYDECGAHVKSNLFINIISDDSDFSSAFSLKRNEIIIGVLMGNIELDKNWYRLDDWPLWKMNLVHEMLHEWQYKVNPMATELAVSLFSKCGNSFYGMGHDEKFFQSIIDKAPYFNLTPLDLINNI